MTMSWISCNTGAIYCVPVADNERTTALLSMEFVDLSMNVKCQKDRAASLRPACTAAKRHVVSCVCAAAHFFYDGKKKKRLVFSCSCSYDDGITIALTTYTEHRQVKTTRSQPLCGDCLTYSWKHEITD